MGGKRLRKDSTAMLVHLSFCVFVDKQTVTCTRVQHFFHMTNIGLFYAVSVGPEESLLSRSTRVLGKNVLRN